MLAGAGRGRRRGGHPARHEGRPERRRSSGSTASGCRRSSAHVYLVLNKPRGVVSTMSDPQGRRTLSDFVADRPERLFHVGRLDTDTDGLILLTNDGDFAHRLAHPSYEVDKTYVAEVEGVVTGATVQQLLGGVDARGRSGHRLRGQGDLEPRRPVHRRAGHPRGPQPDRAPPARPGRPPGAPADPHRDRPGAAGRAAQRSAARARHRRSSARCWTQPASRLLVGLGAVTVRAVRGATQLEADDRDHMLDRVAEMVRDVMSSNDLGRRRLHQHHLHRDLRPARRVPGVRRPAARLQRRTADLRARARDRRLDAAGGADDGPRRDRPVRAPTSPTSTCTAPPRCAAT